MIDNFTGRGTINDTMKINLLGIYSSNPHLLQERNDVMALYNYYNGEAACPEDVMHAITAGQSWITAADLDYTPSQDIRNHVKKLILKQGRFMFGKPPDVLLKPLDKKDKDAAEQKKMILHKIFDDSGFWSRTAKAFLDCTIGKRVLLTVVANPAQPIRFNYYTMPDFTFETDPNDFTRLTQVIIAYLDADTANKPIDKQVWHRWKYYFKGTKCWLLQGTYNGNAESTGDETDVNTGLDELPCRVILNGGLTGDIEGNSDVAELINLQDAYNHTASDYRDALRFKMFEQPVFLNADENSLRAIKIAPNALIDLKTDPSIEGGSADAKMLSGAFSFVQGADSYLDRVKSDMYEIMDQPKPEDLKNVPSAKALKFMFYDLLARCEEKWQDWETVVKWVVHFAFKCVKQFGLYPELNAALFADTMTNIIVSHNYPVPEDEEVRKKLAIAEVEGKVRSHKSYIRDMSDIEDEDGEWQEIIKEGTEITNATDSLAQGMAGLADVDLNAGNDSNADNTGVDKSKANAAKAPTQGKAGDKETDNNDTGAANGK